MDIIINSDFCFNPYNKLTAEISCCALKKYVDGIDSAIKLEGQIPIILDTNILLGYYGMSQKEKDKLIQFIKNYSDRIYITKQVEQEFLKNRISVIKKDFFEPLSKIITDYLNLGRKIGSELKSYKESKMKILSQDFPLIWKELEDIELKISEKLNDEKFCSEIKNKIETATLDNKNIYLIDEMLSLVSTLKITKPLNEEEISFLKTEFDKLFVIYDKAKDHLKWRYAFPGCADKKDDPTGDFIIYHEILKLMKQNSTSCILLTNDITKGDWLQVDRNPHIHYLENTFLRTENILFIVNAEDNLPNISFENIHEAPLDILSAIYGVPNTEKSINVTDVLQQRISNNKLTITASNDIAGDPRPGVPKTLTIIYGVGQALSQISIVEGATATIP